MTSDSLIALMKAYDDGSAQVTSCGYGEYVGPCMNLKLPDGTQHILGLKQVIGYCLAQYVAGDVSQEANGHGPEARVTQSSLASTLTPERYAELTRLIGDCFDLKNSEARRVIEHIGPLVAAWRE